MCFKRGTVFEPVKRSNMDSFFPLHFLDGLSIKFHFQAAQWAQMIPVSLKLIDPAALVSVMKILNQTSLYQWWLINFFSWGDDANWPPQADSKVFVLNSSPFSERFHLKFICSDEGVKLETSAAFFTVAILHHQLSWQNQIDLQYSQTQSHSFFSTLHPCFIYV